MITAKFSNASYRVKYEAPLSPLSTRECDWLHFTAASNLTAHSPLPFLSILHRFKTFQNVLIQFGQSSICNTFVSVLFRSP